MTSIPESSYVLLLFVLTIAGLVKYQSRPDKVFGLVVLTLFITNLVTSEQVIASFANQGVLTLVLLMVCTVALEKTKLLRIIATYVIKPSYRVTWLRLFAFTSVASAMLNNTAVVSAMLSSTRSNPYHASSKLLLPLSYAAIMGGTLTLIGTSTNLIVNSMVVDLGMPPIGFFEFTPIGLAVIIGSGLVLFALSPLLPERKQDSAVVSDYFIDSRVEAGSSLIGRSIEENGLRNLESLFLVEIVREGRLISPVSPAEIIQKSDRLLFSGDVKKVQLLNTFDGLTMFANKNGLTMDNLTEVVIRPDSVLSGKSLKQAGFRALFDAAVVAIKRDGELVSGKLGELVLKPGDFLVLAVGDDFSSRHNISKNFFIVSGVETEHTLHGVKELFAIFGFLFAIVMAAVGVTSLFQSMFLLFGFFLLFRVLTVSEVMQRIPKQIWVIISSALLLSQSLTNTGGLDFLDGFIADYQQSFSPLMGLVVIYILTWWLTELVTNNAAAALMFPIAYGLSVSFGADPMAFIMAVAFGASASFISPYGYQTNLMVFNAGQYNLTDFIKIGLPVSLTYGIIAISAISYFYPVF